MNSFFHKSKQVYRTILSNDLSKIGFIYVLGEVLNKAIPFLILPIIARYLSTSEYGIVNNYTVLVAILSVFTGLSVHGAQSANYYNQTVEDRKKYLFALITILSFSSFVVFVFVFLFKDYIVSLIELPPMWILLAVFHSYATFLTTLNLDLWRLEEKAVSYIVYDVLQVLLNVGLSLWFVVSLKMGFSGRILGVFAAVSLFGILSFFFFFFRKKISLECRKTDLKDALRFGIPLIPHQLSQWIRTGLDRYVITAMIGTSVVGLYATGYQFALVLMVLTTAFNKAYTPYLYKTLSIIDRDSDPLILKKELVKTTYFYFGSILCICVFLYIVILWIVPWLLPENYQDSLRYVFWILLGNAFHGCYYMVVGYIFYVKKTAVLAKITFLSSLLHLVLLFPSLKIFGSSGAAYVYAFSALVIFLWVWYYSNKVYPMPWKIN
ncbi:oligosaccharide flippase family protein [Sinomicrobium kalidii]|uniref:lipopolysaccharide biosynthesis protein n=1 Tax=Sinomicrobium kalidii TaxID=2900738 RepID=UPI001E2EF397|nr:oligosaccharide flippase family protein [Sinomicrobium kalidii]UGU17994.1 oligosaccharide flippase family protein [Sinomicrobium kalidii]